MHSEKEGYAYNELVVHPPMLAIRSPRRILILGGGSLYTAREVLKHPSVEHVDVVDYDPEVTDFVVGNYDAQQAEIKSDPRVRVICADVRAALDQTNARTYDVVVDDLIDVVRPEDRWVLGLYPEIARVLKPGGFFGTYLYPSWYHSELNRLIVGALVGSGLTSVWSTEESVFTYSWPEGFTAYIAATKPGLETESLINSEIMANFHDRKLRTLQFKPEVHRFYPISRHPSLAQTAKGRPAKPPRRQHPPIPVTSPG